MRGFQKIIAPFDGVITNRLVDAGALIQTGSGTNTQLLAMARTDMLRIYIDVPQSVFKAVHIGDTAEIIVPELKGKVFLGASDEYFRAASIPTREPTKPKLKFPNKDHQLTPGAYAQVRFKFDRIKPPLLLPGNAMVTKNDGLYVASRTEG